MKQRVREQMPTIVAVFLTAAITVGGPAVAGQFVENADKVDGKHAVGSGASLDEAGGKLVATTASGRFASKFLPLGLARRTVKIDSDTPAGSFSEFKVPGLTFRVYCDVAANALVIRPTNANNEQWILVRRNTAEAETDATKLFVSDTANWPNADGLGMGIQDDAHLTVEMLDEGGNGGTLHVGLTWAPGGGEGCQYIKWVYER